ncbi:MAG: thioesterase family protein [Deltaproteobacteria bacterium]|nr:thioesterase family protein [Deltaproteobacteria bacterium]
MSADLALDTAVRADSGVPGRFHLTLPDHWDYLMPSGGVAMTCALRAAEAALAEPVLRFASATTIFCTPIHTGTLIADVTILRRGGASAQVRVAMRDADPPPAKPRDGSEAAGDDNVGLEVTATFLRDRKGADVLGVAFPAVKSLADATSIEDGAANNPHTRFRFYHQLDCRIAEGERFWVPDFAPGPARYARWLRYKAPQRDAQGRFDRLALPPLIDTMPTALHRAIGPGNYRFYAPSLDLTTYVVDDTTREWLLIAVTVRRARGGWAIADAEVWDDEGKFIAYGSQAMYLHSLSGEPPVIDASLRPRT